MNATTEITAEQAATEIRRAYNTWTAQYGRDHNDGWMSVGTLAERVDLTPQQVADGIRHLAYTDRNFIAADQAYTALRTPADDQYAVRLGGGWRHIFTWN
ncbi:hypothetical protein [Micromonospora wenchangensis]|uniref:hypothetical protein n=1 Tax=Micromonospora wenchangensis TaxID=1185415 RepID=UPI0038178423